jgi:phosphatidylglycerophosphatase A
MTKDPSFQPAPTVSREKARLPLAIATVLGIGYIPKAPGTFGSLAGIVVAILTHPVSLSLILSQVIAGGIGFVDSPTISGHPAPFLMLVPSLFAIVVIALAGVWGSSRTADYAGLKDPQYIVIDEVSGMHLTLVLAIMPFGLPTGLVAGDEASVFALYSGFSLLNWKYLLLGFILFRVFDIWKPWPIRPLEKLPGGWGIMADDWMAALYAAILLRVALHFGLLTLHIGWV